MEFRTCPHCAASILDDEATDCPSCGKSLSATAAPAKKPAPAAKTPAAKPSAKATERPAATSAGRPEKKGGKIGTTTDPDDPFDLGEDPAAKKAVPVAPKPAKNRMTRVVCPMCDSPGFIPEAALGQDVRCWKKSCPMPVYKAPLPERAPEPEPEKKSKAGLLTAVAGLALVAAIAGGYFYATQAPEEVDSIDMTIAAGPGDGPEADPETDEPDGGLIRRTRPVDTGPELRPLADIRAESIAKIGQASRDGKIENRLAAYARAAEALAIAGQFDQAAEYVNRISSSAAFYRVQPLARIALESLSRGQTQRASQAADAALQPRIPDRGRLPLDSVTELAEALVRLDRADEARDRLRDLEADQVRGEYSALWTGAEDLGSYNIAAVHRESLITATDNPQWLAVTRALVAGGEVDKAREWAQSGPGSVSDDALTMWAATLARVRGRDEAAAAIMKLSGDGAIRPALTARMLAASGLARLEQSSEEVRDTQVAVEAAEEAVKDGTAADDAATPAADGEAPSVAEIARDAATLKAESERAAEEAASDASDLLSQAIAAVQRSPVTDEPMPVPDTVALYQSRRERNDGLPDADPIRNAALAHLKIAELQHARGDDDAAWASIETGLRTLRSMAPAPVAMRKLAEEYRSSRGRITDTLKSALKIDDTTARNRAFPQYRQQVDKYLAAAEDRLRLQSRLLGVALDWGLADRVRGFVDAAAETEPFDTTPIIVRLGGPPKKGPDGDVPVLPSEIRIGQKVDGFVTAGDFDGLTDYLAKSVRLESEREMWAAIAAARWLEDGERETFLKFLASITTDDALVEQLLQRGAAQAATAGIGPQLWNDLQDSTLRRTDGTQIVWDPNHWVAVYRGFAGVQPEETVGASVADAR